MKNLSIKLIPFTLLVAYAVKSLITGVGINEVLLIAILAALTAFYESSLSKKQLKEVQNKLDEITSQQKIQDKIIDDVKSSIVSVKVTSGIKSLTGSGR